MHPYLLRVPLPGGHGFTIASYGFMIVCGFLLCLWLLQRRGRRMGMDPTALFDTAVTILICGIVGARVFYVVQHWASFADDPIKIIRLDLGGLAFFGGLIGGVLGLLVSAGLKGIPILPVLDVGASLVPLGHAFGRIGCFLNGCCYGRLAECAWAVRFPKVIGRDGEIIGSPPFTDQMREGLVTAQDSWSRPVHPTQLYEAGYNLVIFALLSFLLFRRRRPGDVAWLYAILYGAARFTNEFFRADTLARDWLGGLTIFQALALIAVAVGGTMLIRNLRRPRVPLPGPWVPPEPEEEPKPEAGKKRSR
jgi:phosphatidylglycerol:prolipoprotein diacylglycerol transferase